MSGSSELILYTTLGCTLCEKAKLEIWPLLQQYGLQLHEVDIADSDDLLERFHLTIPVVGLGNPDDVLAWPFNQAQLGEWLAQRVG
ncbi:glutaredoxin family protein [Microbulbifer epialgicus]|uniref:Glutaredoxin family protein n=1 Tax=Microbulbifer epialgicus TaxID=393907 RepID=A0ABV4P2H4_9GAMM